jgi:hypothetical protein
MPAVDCVHEELLTHTTHVVDTVQVCAVLLLTLLTHFHLQGVDFTLFAKSVGRVSFRQGSVLLPGRAPSAAKQRKYIDVLPLNNDWSDGYQAKVAQVGCSRDAG